MEKGLLIIISGPSGVGKGTIRQEVMKDPTLNLWYSVSLTTRNQRPGEVNGREYYFVSEKEFEENLDRGNLLEHATFVGHHYGTPLDKMVEKRNEGKNVILEIEVNGTLQVLEKLKGEDIVSIFLMPPSFNGNLENCVMNYVDDMIATHPNIDPKLCFFDYSTMDDAILQKAKERCLAAGFKEVNICQASPTNSYHSGPNVLGIHFYFDGPHPVEKKQ
jgi:guanylate kinase